MPKQFSIYNSGKRNFPAAAEELKVTIIFKDENGAEIFGLNNPDKIFGTIEGYLSKEFEYNATGNYTNIFAPPKPDSIILKVLEDETQRNIANYGYLTKKMYTNGDSPVIDISFRCYGGDDDHTANYNLLKSPIAVANALINATLPRVGDSSIFNFANISKTTPGKAMIDTLKASGEGMIATTKLLASFIPGTNIDVGSVVSDTDKASDEMISSQLNFVNSLGNMITDAKLSDYVSKKPPVCEVRIGNFFEKDMMVVKSVSVKLSKEFINQGVPLYADFDVSLQSLFNSANYTEGKDKELGNKTERIFGSGMNVRGKTSRVTFDA